MPTVEELSEWLPRMMHGLVFTVQITFGAFVLAVVLGLVVAVLRLSPRRRLLYVPATIYVEILRGTPLILQLFFAYFALPSAGLRLSPLVAAILGLGLNTSAYLSEVFRGAILGVDKGQWEASEALAMTWTGMMRHTILPQAFRSAIPPTGNYAIALFKDSALASTVSVSELLFTGQVIGSETFKYMQVYLVIGLLYLALSYPTSRAVLRLERRLDLTTRVPPRRKRPRDPALAASAG
ncbi:MULTISPECIES: amino acid ABC transporter permease [unclassified Mycolicibacterium]|uniref:amino acid ABC transporter permease n=1 Tax=unclassified Mycolicibacterium TaxID=2636767 RepID=UPI001F4C0AA7|nr:amino acid ABC transporter permease [Mycolicibacterium sp. YH-1]UNB51410.1 amino acid ABC transporter permease [Mycolicibacterium sp. YH-1]